MNESPGTGLTTKIRYWCKNRKKGRHVCFLPSSYCTRLIWIYLTWTKAKNRTFWWWQKLNSFVWNGSITCMAAEVPLILYFGPYLLLSLKSKRLPNLTFQLIRSLLSDLNGIWVTYAFHTIRILSTSPKFVLKIVSIYCW